MTKRPPKKPTRRTTTRAKKGPKVKSVAVHTEAERAVAEAAVRMMREGRALLHAARDPKSSMAAFAAVYAAGDAVTKAALDAIEADDEEEPDVVVADGQTWRAVLVCEATYDTMRGPLRKVRKLYRCKRNGPTRCFYEERRGVMPGGFMPDMGRLVIETVSELPAERAMAIIERATGRKLSTATMKRTTTDVGNHLRDEEDAFFRSWSRCRVIPAEARSIVVSVDGLSFNLRGEGYKLSTVATVSLLDAAGDRIATTRIGEMPEAGKATIMDRVQREVRAILKKRPRLKTEVVIDGALDLRQELLRRFPKAVHVTDFFHVVEHIADALRVIFPTADFVREGLRADLCHVLKHEHDGAEQVVAWLRDPYAALGLELDRPRRRLVGKQIAYIEGQMPFLGYAQAANDNLDLGSGPVEAAAKTLVTQRLKISGAKWSRRGARAILYLRSMAQSGRLDDAMDFHHANAFRRAA